MYGNEISPKDKMQLIEKIVASFQTKSKVEW